MFPCLIEGAADQDMLPLITMLAHAWGGAVSMLAHRSLWHNFALTLTDTTIISKFVHLIRLVNNLFQLKIGMG